MLSLFTLFLLSDKKAISDTVVDESEMKDGYSETEEDSDLEDNESDEFIRLNKKSAGREKNIRRACATDNSERQRRTLWKNELSALFAMAEGKSSFNT